MTRRGNGIPCDHCGGEDRNIPIWPKEPDANGNPKPPFRFCTHCGAITPMDDSDIAALPKLQRYIPSDEDRPRIWEIYRLVADWCHEQLYTEQGRATLDYLHQRGFTDETIRHAKLGYMPRARDLGWLRSRVDQATYDLAGKSGIAGKRLMPLSKYQGSITIPYWYGDECRLLRFRSPQHGYLAPFGISLYGATGDRTPDDGAVLYNGNCIAEAKRVILTEGEFKALLCWQHGISAVAQPGLTTCPLAFWEQLARKEVIVCYDSERRRDPFELAAGEQGTLRIIPSILGIRERAAMKRAQAVMDAAKDDDERQQLVVAYEEAKQEYATFQRRGIRLKVLRLPRTPDQEKIDLDSFILAHGPDELRRLVEQAGDAERWWQRRKCDEYWYRDGQMYGRRMVRGASVIERIANYQAIITQDIDETDGETHTTRHLLVVKAPSGAVRQRVVDGDVWSDNHKAMQALRNVCGEGSADDEGLAALKATRALSGRGDGTERVNVYTATGWEQIDGRWHYLVRDGAITAHGFVTNHRAEVGIDIPGNWYSFDTKGNAAIGAAAWLYALRGGVCPQEHALILGASAALAPLHRWVGDSARLLNWVFERSGALKTSLIRAFALALYGPQFTAVRADGAFLPNWNSTANALTGAIFHYRDLLVLVDDYKPVNTDHRTVAQTLHNYAEGRGRGRMRADLKMQRALPPRGLMLATGEDTPQGDLGLAGRMLAMHLREGSVDPDALAHLQQAGVDGHLAAFWSGFIQYLARSLDNHGPERVQTHLQALLATDDAALPGHLRTAGALRQNRLAFLVLTDWLLQAGYIDQAEQQELRDAHLAARDTLAHQQAQRQATQKASTIYLETIQELLSQGYILEQQDMECPTCGTPLEPAADGWVCCGQRPVGDKYVPCTYKIQQQYVIGFIRDDAVCIYPRMSFKLVQQVCSTQRQPLHYSASAVYDQLDADGLLLKRQQDRTTINQRNPARDGKIERVLVFARSTFDGTSNNDFPSNGSGSGVVSNCATENKSRGTNFEPLESDKQGIVPHVPLCHENKEGSCIGNELLHTCVENNSPTCPSPESDAPVTHVAQPHQRAENGHSVRGTDEGIRGTASPGRGTGHQNGISPELLRQIREDMKNAREHPDE